MRTITDEEIRIMRAIEDGDFGVNEHGRYVIKGQARPDRKARVNLMNREWIDWRWRAQQGTVWFVTDKGREALESVGENNLPPAGNTP